MLSRRSCSRACSKDNSSLSTKCLGKYKVPRSCDVGVHEGYWLETVEGLHRTVLNVWHDQRDARVRYQVSRALGNQRDAVCSLKKQLLEGDAFKICEGCSCVSFFDGMIPWCSRLLWKLRKKRKTLERLKRCARRHDPASATVRLPFFISLVDAEHVSVNVCIWPQGVTSLPCVHWSPKV